MVDASFPEGWVLLAILFIFPYLLARKNKFNAEEIIHAYMEDTEKRLISIIDKLYAVRSSHAKACDTYRKTLQYHSEKLHYNVFGKPRYILGSVLYMVVKRLSHSR